MRRLALLAAVSLVPNLGRADRKEAGSLVMDGIPGVPPEIAERLEQYQNTRAASLLDWDPAGKGILISTRFADVPQVHLVAAPGAARQQLTFFKEPITEAAFDPARAEGFYFRMDAGGGEFFQYYWYDLAAGRRLLVTDGKARSQGLLVGNAGGRFAFTSTLRDGKDFDLYIGKGPEARPALRKELAGDWIPLDWSPDDGKLLIKNDISINESHIHIVDAETGDSHEIAAPAEGKKVAVSVARFGPGGRGVFFTTDEDSELARLAYLDLATGKRQILSPEGTAGVERLEISRDRRWLAYTLNQDGKSALFVAGTAEPSQATQVAIPSGVVTGLAFDRQSRRLGLALNSSAAPADVYVFDLAQRSVERWTSSEVGGLPRSRFVEPSLVQYPTFDARRISAWLYKPRATGKKLPVVISIHGGPESQERPIFNPLYQYWVNELGAAVVAPNVRGSSGYGKSYLLLDNGFKREDSIKDIGALLDWIAKQPDLDPKRVAVYGGSYGGFMVLASLYSYPERIRCGVDVVGISNMLTFLEHTEAYRRDLRRVEYGDEREPKMREFLERIAPTTNAAKIKSPLFVVQGANDPRVPASEAEAIVKIVRGNGGKVWFLVAKDEGHGFQKKSNKDYYQAAVTLFFDEYLLK